MRSHGLDSRGFTLPELLVMIPVFVTILGVTGTLFANGVRVFSREAAAVSHQNDLAAAKSILLDDLSIVGFGLSTGNPLTFVDSTTDDTDAIVFLGDVNSDIEEAGGSLEKICYDVSGGALRRSVQGSGESCGSGTGGWQTIATEVTEFNLSFFNSSRSVITTDSSIMTSGVQCWPPPAAVMTPPNANAACYVRVALTAAETVRQQVVQKRLTGEAAIRN